MSHAVLVYLQYLCGHNTFILRILCVYVQSLFSGVNGMNDKEGGELELKESNTELEALLQIGHSTPVHTFITSRPNNALLSEFGF